MTARAFAFLLTLLAAATARAADDARVAELERRNEALAERVERLEATALDAEVEDYLARTDGARPGGDGAVVAPGVLRLRVSGQVRARFEVRDRIYAPGDPDGADSFELTRLRTRLRFDAELADALGATVELQDVRRLGGGGATTADTEGLDLKRAFLSVREVFGTPVTVDVGRFVLAYGDQRLVGHLEWVDQGRTYDGLRLLRHVESWWLDFFAVQVRETQAAGEDTYFTGVVSGCGAWEFSLLGLFDQRVAAGEGGSGRTRFATVGARYHAERERWDYTLEVAAQVGELAGDDLVAWAVAFVLGHTFEDAAWTPRVAFEVAWASGDDDPADGDAGRFQVLFPTNHLHYGYADLFSWSNLVDLHLRVSARPATGVTVALDYHHFRRAEETDGWFNAAGALVRAGQAGTSSHLGDELDLTVTWSPRDGLKLLAGYSIFLPGDFVEQTGDDPLTHFLYLQVLLVF